MSRAATLAQLARLCDRPDEEIDIAEAALALAALDRPRVPLARYRAVLAEIVAAVAAEAGTAPDLAAQAAALSGAIAHRLGYQGDDATYDDPQNANLIRVIDRKRGLPVALGILYIHAAASQGWQLSGLSFPGHFLVRLAVGRDAAILDPFNGGAVLSPADLRRRARQVGGEAAALRPDHFQPVSRRNVLLRLQNNLKSRAVGGDDMERAAAILESMVTLAPREAWTWREFGLAHAMLGNLNQALDSLGRAGALSTDEAARAEIAELTRRVRNRLN
ncbi:MAG: transglutaminase family protein [Alphaproteobacteria bacterium]|nr:transglutaminase family protein [Alphaproteobacteria bacterium]